MSRRSLPAVRSSWTARQAAPAGGRVNRLQIIGVVTGVVVAIPLIVQRSAPPGLSVKIISPADDSYISGATTLRAQVDPPDAPVTLAFYVDGRLVCRAAKPLYECQWDAGPAIAEHQIRVVATASSGPPARAVATISTQGVGVAESVDVDLVQVTA